jgi:hypothetical protein
MTFNSNNKTFKERHGYNWAELSDTEDNNVSQQLNLDNLVVDNNVHQENIIKIYLYGIILYKGKLITSFYLQSSTQPEYTGIYIRDDDILHLIDVRLTKQVAMMKNIMIKYNIIYTV